ncbi:imidazole glycerol phosphate synthase subunit HisF [Pseudomonadota bacterium]
MTNVRVIPRLDIKGPNLVKGIHLEGLRVLGKPRDFARYYYERGADELIYQDVVASLYERNSLHDLITRTAKEIAIPLTVGGGLRSIGDIRDVLRAGADKVCLNTAAIKDPNLINEAAYAFGSSTIVIAIEAIRQKDNSYLVYTDHGREYTGVEVVEWAKKVETLGAGEILLTSVDRDGTGLGYDIALTKMTTAAVSIPVIAHGGPGNVSHISTAIDDGGADAVAVASMLHYDFIMGQESSPELGREGNTTFLQSGRNFSKVNPSGLPVIKEHLLACGVNCRPAIVPGDLCV